METVQGRLASFKLQPSKRKVNEPYSTTSAWPHHPKHFSVTPSTLASAGFYHDPTESAPDNVTCLYCSKGLEGWEDGDDALDEHLKRILDKSTGDRCPWATIMGVKRDYDLFGPDEFEAGNHDPTARHLLDARKKTFGEWWKFDGKKGWKPTSERLAQAGFYSNPLVDAPDTCACTYCDVQLDGWSKSDDPEEEHRSRQPDCFFFTAKGRNESSSTKATSSKASTSRSRANTRAKDEFMVEDSQSQSTSTTTNKLAASTSGKKKASKKRSATSTSIAHEPEDAQALEDDEVGEMTTNVEESANTTQVEAKPTKATSSKSRKSKAASASTAKKATGRSTKGKIVEPPNEIIDIESEDEPVEPPPPIQAKPAPKARKRTTRATTDVLTIDDAPPPEPPKKMKAPARSRSKKVDLQHDREKEEEESTVPSDVAPTENENDTEVSEAEPLQSSRSRSKKATTSKAKLSKSTSSAGSRTTKAKKSATPRVARKTDDVVTVEESTDNDNEDVAPSTAEESVVGKEENGKRRANTRSKALKQQSSISDVEMETTIVQPSDDESVAPAIVSAVPTEAAPPVPEQRAVEPTTTTSSKTASKKAPSVRKTTRSKTVKKTSTAPTRHSTRSGNTSDSTAGVTESEASYATQSDDEGITHNFQETVDIDMSRSENVDASTPKAVQSVMTIHTQKQSHISTTISTSSMQKAVQLQQADSHVPAAQPARELRQPPPEAQVVSSHTSTHATKSSIPSAERPVKPLPPRKSAGDSTRNLQQVQNNNLSKPLPNGPTTAPTTGNPGDHKHPQMSRGQSALDALLSAPMPTFDSPDKRSAPTSSMAEPLPPLRQPLSAVSPTVPQVATPRPTTKDQSSMNVKEWIEMLREREMERFAMESRRVLADFDRQTQKKRDELFAFLNGSRTAF